jgi:hypothetical protein
MTILSISELKVHQDDLGRYVTTLTQEVFVKVNQAEEDLFVATLDEQEDCIEYSDEGENCTTIEARGYAINKAIEVVNNVAEHTLIAPITEIENDNLYRIEFEH